MGRFATPWAPAAPASMTPSPSFDSILPGAAAGALVAALVLVLAPSNPAPTANAPAGTGPRSPGGISSSEAELLALLREIRDELHGFAPPGRSAAQPTDPPVASPLEFEPSPLDNARRSVGEGRDAELVAALRELNETLRKLPTHVPQSSLPPRGSEAPDDRLTVLGLNDFIQMAGFEDDDRWEAWDRAYNQEHYGFSAAELSERYGPPDEFHPMNGGSALWNYEHDFGDGSFAFANFRLVDGLVIEAECGYHAPR